jgi:hypothetical protein
LLDRAGIVPSLCAISCSRQHHEPFLLKAFSLEGCSFREKITGSGKYDAGKRVRVDYENCLREYLEVF